MQQPSRCLTAVPGRYLLCAGLLLALQPVCPRAANATSRTLYLLALVPYAQPAPVLADSVMPAIRLAVQHVNERADILPGYSLSVIGGNSGCPAPALDVLVNLTDRVFHSERKVAAIVGPACVAPTVNLGDLARRQPRGMSLLHLSSSDSPQLNDAEFFNTFRSIGSALSYVNTFSSLVREMEWRRVATFYEALPYFVSLHQLFYEENADIVKYSAPLYDHYLPVSDLQKNKVRIVFMFASVAMAKKLLCVSYHHHLVYPTIQWFTPGLSSSITVNVTTFWYNEEYYSCTQEEMREAASGMILLTYKLERLDRSTNDTIAEISFDQYRKQLISECEVYTPYMNVYYDAVWALSLAMNDSMGPLEDSGYDLSEYDYRQENATKIIRKQLLNVTFEGMSGHFEFNKSTRDNIHIPVDIMQIPVRAHSQDDSPKHIGYYLDHSLELEQANASFTDDEFEEWFDELPVYIGCVLLVFAMLILLMTFSLHFMTCYFRRYRSVKATSTTLSPLIFSGCYLFLLAACSYVALESFVVSLLTEVTERFFIVYSVWCNLYCWCIFIGYSFIFGTVCMKTWRIYSLFASFRRFNNVFFRDESLVGYVLLQVCVDIAVLSAWNFDSPMLLHQSEDLDEKEAVIHITLSCQSDKIHYVITLLVYKVIQTIPVVVFAVLTRRVHKKEFKSTKSINALVYILVLFCGLAALVYVAFLEVRLAQHLIIFVVLTVCVILCDIFLFIPPTIPVFQKKGFVPSAFQTL